MALLTGSQPAAARREALLDAASGAAGIVIGTHALLTDNVQFAELGLVVIDEQHRFGVEQRDALREKAQDARPHVLVMTATPIPRTVAMTVFGDLDVSTLTELPRGRSPIATHVVPALEKPRYLDRAWQRVREEAEKGSQAYVVCPRIGGEDGPRTSRPADSPEPGGAEDGGGVLFGEDDDGEPGRPPLAVLDVAPALAEGPLAGLRLRILHGRLPSRREGQGDAGLRRRVRRRAGGDHRRRGGRRRAERDRHGHHGRGPVRRVPAAPVARPGGPGQRARALPPGHRGSRGKQGAGAGRGRGRHPGRVPARRDRPGAAPGGRRARRGPGRAGRRA